MVRLCGAALGLFAFSITILLGLLAGNPANVVLLRALQAMLAFCLLGMCAGWVAYRILDEHALRKHREMFPAEGQAEQSAGVGPAGSEDKGKPPSAEGRQGVARAR
ncbi:MAG: hypothetical protein GX616_12840 [Planctomycetes bacterium]|nr:hypothetical protein [Planctomycetota bacterium]